MTRTLALAAALLSAALPTLPTTAQEWQPRRIAELQALDKVTARITVLRATIGDPVRFGSLAITVRACQARPPDEVPDAAAWLEIADSRPPANGATVFRGWMFANTPAVNMLEHAVYDVRVLDCQ